MRDGTYIVASRMILGVMDGLTDQQQQQEGESESSVASGVDWIRMTVKLPLIAC